LSTREEKAAGSIRGGDHGPAADAGRVAETLVEVLTADDPHPHTKAAATASVNSIAREDKSLGRY
jgi:hypothetical protein